MQMQATLLQLTCHTTLSTLHSDWSHALKLACAQQPELWGDQKMRSSKAQGMQRPFATGNYRFYLLTFYAPLPDRNAMAPQWRFRHSHKLHKASLPMPRCSRCVRQSWALPRAQTWSHGMAVWQKLKLYPLLMPPKALARCHMS